MSEAAKSRPEFRNLNLFADIPTYRMPVAGYVSILHRISGALIFVLLPFIIWLFDKSVSSQIAFGQFSAAFSAGLWVFPGWFVKLVVLVLIWGYLHHFCAGLRYLVMDVSHTATSKEFGKNSGLAVLAASLLLTALCGAKLFGAW